MTHIFAYSSAVTMATGNKYRILSNGSRSPIEACFLKRLGYLLHALRLVGSDPCPKLELCYVLCATPQHAHRIRSLLQLGTWISANQPAEHCILNQPGQKASDEIEAPALLENFQHGTCVSPWWCSG
jgi:hypothetical protein